MSVTLLDVVVVLAAVVAVAHGTCPGFHLENIDILSAGQPWNLQAIDMNADGCVDLVSAQFGGPGVKVYYSDPSCNGTFPTSTVMVVPGTTASCKIARAGDLNGDGILDVVASNSLVGTAGSVVWWAGPNFTTAQYVMTNIDTPIGVELADFNNDGALDVVIAAKGANAMMVLFNNGSGGFSLVFVATTGAAGAISVDVADFDKNGLMDIVLAARTSNSVTVFRNTGGGFVSMQTFSVVDPRSVRVADMNGDNRLDIIATSGSGGNVVCILTNSPAVGSAWNATFTKTVVSPMITIPLWAVGADVNADGRMDLVVSTENVGGVYVFYGTASTPYSVLPVATNVSQARSAIAVDIDGDGDLDIVYAAQGANGVYLARNGCNSTATTTATTTVQTTTTTTVVVPTTTTPQTTTTSSSLCDFSGYCVCSTCTPVG